MTKLEFSEEAKKTLNFLEKAYPQADFVVWDLAPLIPQMHYWRKNMVFVECDPIAVEPVAESLSGKFKGAVVYAGARKPRLEFKQPESTLTFVVVGRDAKVKLGVDGKHAKIEKCLVDLLYYARNEYLPITLFDVLDLWRSVFESRDSFDLHFNEFYRYASRRYLGWFVSVFVAAVLKKEHPGVDSRHLAQGKKNLELVKLVENLES